MRQLWGCLWLTQAWSTSPRPPSAFVAFRLSARKHVDGVFRPGSHDFNNGGASHPRTRPTGNSIDLHDLMISKRGNDKTAPAARFPLLCMGGGQTHEKDGSRIDQQQEGDGDSNSVKARENEADGNFVMYFMRLVTMLMQPSQGELLEQSTLGGSSSRNIEVGNGGVDPGQKKTDAKGTNPRLLSKPTKYIESSDTGAVRAKPEAPLLFRWLRPPWRNKGIAVVEGERTNSTAVAGTSTTPVYATVSLGDRTLASDQRPLVLPTAADATESSADQGEQEGKLAAGAMLSIMRLVWPWSQVGSSQPSLAPRAADGSIEIDVRETYDNGDEEGLLFETILSMVKLGWPWSEQDTNDARSPPVSIDVEGNQGMAPREEAVQVGEKQDGVEESIFAAIFSTFNHGWAWLQGGSNDEARSEADGWEPPMGLPGLRENRSSRSVPMAPEKASNRWWWLLGWGRGKEDQLEGKTGRQPKEAQKLSRNTTDRLRQTTSISASGIPELPPSPSWTPPYRDGAVKVNRSVRKASATPSRGPYSRIIAAVRRPVLIVRNKLRKDVGAVAVPATVYSFSGFAPSTVLSLPVGARRVRDINTSNPSFPLRAPRRPPGYRWGVSLLSKKSTTSSGEQAKNKAREDVDQDLRDSSTYVAVREPSSNFDLEMDKIATMENIEPDARGVASRSNLATARSRLMTRLGMKGAQGSQEVEGEAIKETDSVSDPNQDQVEGWSEAEVEEGFDPGTRDRDMPWWQGGTAVLLGAGAVLYRPVANKLPWIFAEAPPADEIARPERRNLVEAMVSESTLPRSTAEAVAGPTILRTTGGEAIAESSQNGTQVRLEDVERNADSDLKAEEKEATEPNASPPDRTRGASLRGLTTTALDKLKTTSRRARLWMLLRRRSRARAKPLLPGVDSDINTLSVPLTSLEKMSPLRGNPELGLPQASVVQDADTLQNEAAPFVESNEKVPQVMGGGGGWNFFAFFPKDKDEERSNSRNAGAVPVATKNDARNSAPATTQTSSLDKMDPLDESVVSTKEKKQATAWPGSAFVEGLDPRAQIESAMAQYLRSTFGYGIGEPATGVTEETLAAAAAAAGDAALLEGQKQLEAKASTGRAPALDGEKEIEGKSASPTARYLGDLSPASDKETVARWSGSEAAAAAAEAAAGAVMDAAGVAAGVAADVAAAATAATYNVAAPFGQAEEEDEGWQVTGSTKKGKTDAGEFGKGKLTVKPRSLDPLKASDMIIDPVSSNSLRRSVARDERKQGNRSPRARLLSTAMRRPRLRRRGKSKAAGATLDRVTPSRDVDMQENTLRRLGRVGVTEIASSMLLIASETASQVGSVEQLELFREEGGMPRLLMALSPIPYTTKADGLAAIRNLLRVSPESVAAEILETAGKEALFELRRLVGAPGEPWSSAAAQAAAAASDSFDAMRLQAEAVQVLQELSLASDEALSEVRELPNLIPALSSIVSPRSGLLGTLKDKIGRSLGGMNGFTGSGGRADAARRMEKAVSAQAVSAAAKLLSMLGVHTWRPRQPGQKGLRILSLDGGGTRGVLTIAILREILQGFEKDVHEVFDVICGTSTGGILAMLFAAEKQSLASVTAMYDSLVVKIFTKDLLANAKLVLWQAQYSSTIWEAVLEEILGERRMIDTISSADNPKVVICSTIINVNPLEMMLWRNYGFRPDQETVYKGDYRRRMRECVRATTAAPSFFTPLVDGDMMYADGAFMANNPTSIAITEDENCQMRVDGNKLPDAKLLYPDVPIECVLSVGTGYYSPQLSKSGMSWNTVVNQLVNSATDTEGVDTMLKTFLPRRQYFRFNPSIEPFNIDEIRPERLNELKELAKEYVARPEVKARAEELRRLLRGEAS